MPSLDIRDGALDFLFNVYKRILPSLGDYITNHGGQVNLSHVDVILAEVGAIEDHVFAMKHENEEREKQRREEFKARKKQANGRSLDAPPPVSTQAQPKVMGRAARILEKQKEQEHALKKQGDTKIKSSHMRTKENLEAALALKQSLGGAAVKEEPEEEETKEENDVEIKTEELTEEETSDVKMEPGEESSESKVKVESGQKRKLEEVEGDSEEAESGIGLVGDAKDEFDGDDEDDGDEDEELEPIKIEISEDVSPEVATAFKDRVKDEQKKKLDEYAKTVEDKVRLHEKGWKDRYYSDKCKADDVANHGGREHLFRSYIVGLCWVMKYYYEGCKSCTFFCDKVFFESLFDYSDPFFPRSQNTSQVRVGNGTIHSTTPRLLPICVISNVSKKMQKHLS